MSEPITIDSYNRGEGAPSAPPLVMHGRKEG